MRKYIIPIFLILLCSCVEDLRIKGEFIPELIVNGFLCPDSCITVHISKTRPIKSSGTPNLYDLRRLDIQVSINEGVSTGETKIVTDEVYDYYLGMNFGWENPIYDETFVSTFTWEFYNFEVPYENRYMIHNFRVN